MSDALSLASSNRIIPANAQAFWVGARADRAGETLCRR